MLRKNAVMLGMLLLSAILLAGCGGSGGGGTTVVDPVTTEPAVLGTDSCKVCHTAVVASGWNNTVHDTAAAGCEGCHGGGEFHRGIGPIPYAAPKGEQCGSCHTELPAEVLMASPFSNEIAERFASSRHANQSARNAYCSACHSHEGGIALLAMERITADADLEVAYTADTVEAYSLPVGSSTIVGVTKKTCATCHEPHTATLRGDGDITAGMLGAVGTTTQEGTVVFSAEFNLCTACHVVDVAATNIGTGNNGKLIYNYTLSDAYAAANLIDAASGTYNFGGILYDAGGATVVDGNGDPVRLPNNKVFYHDGASGNGRTMIDTHFGGTILSHLVDFAGGDEDMVITGYNINAGAENACTVCHDPHTGGKMLSVEVGQGDNINNLAIGYAEGLGTFHGNYQGTASYRASGCTPCHTGDAFAATTLGATLASSTSWGSIGCRACHDLAQANAVPASNNSEAFAAVREFPATYAFAFNSGAPVDVIDLGVNQVCFDCHKGRTAGVLPTADPAAGTTNYSISYLHYAPSMAILFGNESDMVLTYEDIFAGRTYTGKFVHPVAVNGVTEFGCVDCHNVHTAENYMETSTACLTCHDATATLPIAELEGRTEAYSVRLLETIYDEMAAAYALSTTDNARYLQFDASLRTVLENIFVTLDGDRAAQDLALMEHIQGRQTYFPSALVARAVATWKIFTYEDGAPHGQTHGHGGSWAHNSLFARQVMYDAIESLGGDLTGLGILGDAARTGAAL